MFKRITAASLFSILALSPILAQANTAKLPCAPRDSIVETLRTTHGEARTGAGLQGQNGVFEIWVSEKTDAWTITRTMPNGLTCIMAVGQHWMAIDEPQGVQS